MRTLLSAATFSIVVAAIVVASTRAADAACPSVETLTSRDGKTYLATFEDRQSYSGALRATFYTATRSYVARVAGVDIATAGGARGFRSAALSFANPHASPLQAATLAFDDVGAAGSPCVDRTTIAAPSPPATDATGVHAGRQPEGTSTSVALAFVREEPAIACADPHRPASIAGVPATIAYPEIARQEGATGTVEIVVSLDATGEIAKLALYSSSGNGALDASAMSAASRTKYHPELFRCAAVSGAYLYKASFGYR